MLSINRKQIEISSIHCAIVVSVIIGGGYSSSL